jgi:hypothetical protein
MTKKSMQPEEYIKTEPKASIEKIETKNKASIEKIESLRREDASKAVYEIGQELTKLFESFERQGLEKRRFYKYVEDKFHYSRSTTIKYMNIYKLIPLTFINNAKNILLGHLYSLIKMNSDEERTIFMDAMLLLEKDSYITQQSIKLKTYYRKNDISSLKHLRDKDKSGFDTAEKIKSHILDKMIVPKVTEAFNKRKQDNSTRGQQFENNPFTNLYVFEPTTEQGVVGLFCTIFHLIAKPEFKFRLGNKIMSFSRIQIIQTAFPDALLECIVYDNKGKITGLYDLYVEFEYKSQNYLRHSHQSTPKKFCEMVICWENDWDEKPYVYILSLKELLNKGKVILRCTKD